MNTALNIATMHPVKAFPNSLSFIPQEGHFSAFELTLLPHSLHLMIAMLFPLFVNIFLLMLTVI